MLKKLFKKKIEEKPTLSRVLDKHLSVLVASYRIKNMIFTISVCMAIFLMAYRFIFMEQDNIAKSQGHIAVVEFSGVVSSGNDLGNGLLISQAIEDAYTNSDAKAIVIRANSGGGSPVQAEMINSTIKKLRHQQLDKAIVGPKAGKEIIVVIEDMCASACYLSMAPSDKLIAHPSSMVGSIGVRIDSWQFSDAIERYGVERVTLTSGKNKALLDPFVKMTPEQTNRIQEGLISPTYELFVNAVKDARGDKLAVDNTELFSGMVFVGAEAKTLGLIDEVDTLNNVFASLKEQYSVTNTVIYNEQPFSLSSIIQSSFDKAITTLMTNHVVIR